MQVLTDALIAGLQAPESGRTEIADARCIGLAIRVTSGGSKSFSFKYRMRGRGVQRCTLGTYPALGLAKARRAADAMREDVADGKDPATARREERTGGRLFGALAALYVERHARRKKRPASAAADERNLRLHVLPRWSKRDYAKITRADVIDLVEGLIKQGKVTLANRVHALISKIFSFAIEEGLRSDHPCARMPRRGVERIGERVLSDLEIRAFWNGIGEGGAPRQAALGLKLALLVGARVGEVAGINRAELMNIESDQNAAWSLPGSRTKNKRDHLMPLNPLARGVVLELLAGLAPAEQFLIPGRFPNKPLGTNRLWQVMADFADRVGADYGNAFDTWASDTPSPHDLRRTTETRLASIGIPKEIRDRILNHAPKGTGDKHYNKYDYAPEKKHGLGRWESLLGTIIDGRAVVLPFAPARAVL
jgi:integrase